MVAALPPTGVSLYPLSSCTALSLSALALMRLSHDESCVYRAATLFYAFTSAWRLVLGTGNSLDVCLYHPSESLEGDRERRRGEACRAQSWVFVWATYTSRLEEALLVYFGRLIPQCWRMRVVQTLLCQSWYGEMIDLRLCL